ncbi:hypothetical protein FVR03_18920 [Pontibacter qinzhouensis]|uniref:STAS/SEC14 domain-containing protein n=1 Tax=Pontibacter qinzhouensis TaxID=2603253 RepID=A0A5C8J9U4_9BACT|nr:hypothetical protein [Pontibacter qinzhouensis]TXK33733.1 hypothetical protein FVR03_18920 [Pontibacter qinzhouensis]
MSNRYSDITSNKSKIVIAENACYDLSYDSLKNRVYLTIRGFWKSQEAVPHYISDLQKALKLALPGFTILTDMQQMVTHPQAMNMVHVEAHQLVLEMQVASIAHIIPSDKIAKLQVSSIASQTGIPVHNFNSQQEAEIWLDQQSDLLS